MTPPKDRDQVLFGVSRWEMDFMAAMRPPSPPNDAESVLGMRGAEPGLESMAAAFGQCLVVYYGMALVLHLLIPLTVETRNVQKAKQKTSDTIRDASRSLLPVAIKSLTLFAAEWMHYKGYGVMNNAKLLDVVSDPSRLMEVACMVMMLDLFHDTWFYFTHRLLHSRWMMKNVHYMHHQSTNPSAFTGYSFHW